MCMCVCFIMCLKIYKIKSTVMQMGVVDKNGICEAIDECGNVNSYLMEAHDSLILWFISLNFDKCTVFRRRTSI